MTDIQINNKFIEVPDSWYEMTLRQKYTACHFIMSNYDKMIEDLDEIHLLKLLLLEAITDFSSEDVIEFRKSMIKAEGAEYGLLIADDLLKSMTSSIFEFIWTENEDNELRIELTMLECPYTTLTGTFKGEKHKFYAAKDELDNITFYEMITIFEYLDQYQKTKNESLLNKLIAVVYRPKKQDTRENKESGFHGDWRLPYRNYESTVAQRAEIIATIPKETKSLILLWLMSCRDNITYHFNRIFSGGGSGEQSSWSEVLLSLAENMTDINQVSDTHHWTALKHIDVKMKHAEEVAKRYKSRTS